MMNMNDHSTGDKLALQKRGEQTNAGAAEYSDTIRTGLAWAKGTLPVGTYNDLAQQVYAILRSNDPNRYEQAARALSGMMDESARQQKAFQDATEGSKVTSDPAGKNNKPGKNPSMSDDEIDAFLKEELGGDTTGNGTYASADVAKGGTKTIGYDPNPDNVSLAYAMRNAPEQERKTALINKWNQEHGREPVSLTRSSSTYASPGISRGGTYATGEGIKDADGNVLTNPGGDWEYQYALKDPQYGLGMMGKMSDAQKKYLQAVADNMGYNYNFTGANRLV